MLSQIPQDTGHCKAQKRGSIGRSKVSYDQIMDDPLSNDTPVETPLSPTSVMVESANLVTTDPWENMRENNLINVGPNEHTLVNNIQISTKAELATHRHQTLGSSQCQ